MTDKMLPVHAMNNFPRIAHKHVMFFFDFDGTLTPIVARPELATLNDNMRQCIEDLNRKHFVSIISGRSLTDLQKIINLGDIICSGNHGLEISDSEFNVHHLINPGIKSTLEELYQSISNQLGLIPGILIEYKILSITVHYRLVENKYHQEIEHALNLYINKYPEFCIHSGKKVFEIRPDVDWNKGHAVMYLYEKNQTLCESLPVYIGDDNTDEDAFKAIQNIGIGILISNKPRTSAAKFYLKDPNELLIFLQQWLN